MGEFFRFSSDVFYKLNYEEETAYIKDMVRKLAVLFYPTSYYVSSNVLPTPINFLNWKYRFSLLLKLS